MSRSGYSKGYDYCNLYDNAVNRAFTGKRGKAFLIELAKALDEMPVKRLIRNELVSKDGEVCAIGAFCVAKKIDVKDVEVYDPESVGKTVGIARAMAAEIEYENDDGNRLKETPEERWIRMRKWVQECIDKGGPR